MKNYCYPTVAWALLSMATLSLSCGKKSSPEALPQAIDSKTTAKNDTLLNVTYETGTSSSGITGLTATYAAATDAAYMVSPGASGNYAIAHKIVYGNTSYYSAENWRSESDADQVSLARFLPGQERRYEVSLLLKDWVLDPNDATESNLFQLKLTGPNEVPLQIRTTRNAIVLRFATANKQPNVTVLDNAQNYVNQWIHFRVDVLWSQTATGYMKTYMKLPGERDYTLKDGKTNYLTYNADALNGQHGYIKWGLYILPANTTRIAYHDDIRIVQLPLK